MTTAVDTTREDPLVSFHFEVEIQGQVSGYFKEVSGLGSEHEVIESKEQSAGTEVTLKLPGRLKWENIVMKRGITSEMDMWIWRKKIEDGQVDGNRADGTISMLNQAGDPVAMWSFFQAWPTKISGPSIKSDSNEIGVEELTLTHEGIERTQ